jgi:DNA adenine methylase
MNTKVLKPPFQYAGGKKRLAPYIWSRIGNVRYYIEPFCGSAACLLGRPHAPQDELLGDACGFVSNAWRSMKAAPEEMAHYCYFISSEADLYARHHWLMDQAAAMEAKVRSDPDWYDAKIAAYWVWGQNLWIGSGWCHRRLKGRSKQRQHIQGQRGTFRCDKRQHVGRDRGTFCNGRNGETFRDGVDDVQDYLNDLIDRVENNYGGPWQENLLKYFRALSLRLSRVHLFHGDWTRCLSKGVLNRAAERIKNQITGVFLDPTYDSKLCDSDVLYPVLADSAEVRAWAIEHGERPDMRVCLAGLEGEHTLPDNWTVKPWTNSGGQFGKRNQERLWFSPYCLPEEGGEVTVEEPEEDMTTIRQV